MKYIEIEAGKTGYVSVPKCACTSIKRAIYAYQHGEEFVYDHSRPERHVHDIYSKLEIQSESKPKPEFMFSVIRDPIEKLLSAYSNRVTFHNELSQEKLVGEKKEGLIDTVVRNSQGFSRL